MALLGDVPILALDPASWNIHFHWPWARQASAEGDVEKLKSHFKLVLRNMIRYVHETAQQAQLDCEYRDKPSQSPSPFLRVPAVPSFPPGWHLWGLIGCQQLLKG